MPLVKCIKKAKAFDLIKKKKVNFFNEIIFCDNYKDAYLCEVAEVMEKKLILTEDEWNFLKEMSEDE